MAHKLSKKQIKEVVKRCTEALYLYCRKNNIHHVVTGSSGGLDSAVTLGLAQRACQLAAKDGYSLTSVGLILPCKSTSESKYLGRLAMRKFGAEEIRIDLTSTFEFIEASLLDGINGQVARILAKTKSEALEPNTWEWSEKIAQGNIRARLRMMLGTYHVARMMKGMVLSTDNLSELWMAFWTINGDVGDYGMIQNIMKGLELYDVAEYINVPKEILGAKPDDGLGVAGGDEDQLGASYSVLDRVLVELIQKGFNVDGPKTQLRTLPKIEGVADETVYSLAERCLNGAFKRQGTIVLSRKDLGLPDIKDIEL